MSSDTHQNSEAAAMLLLASIVESSDDAIISKDLSGTILTWNRAAEQIFGYKASEVIGGPISVIIPPDKSAEESDILQRIGRGERLEHFETVRMSKDGQRIELSVTISPLVKEGRVIGASKIARPIGEQKRIQREIERERMRLHVTLSSIGDAVIVTDANGQVSFMNGVAESLTGWKDEDAIGLPLEAVFNIVNETTRRRVENPVARALREGIIVGLANHTILIAKGGAEYAIDDSAAPIRNGETELWGVVLVFRDVSGARAANDFRARLAAIVQSSDDAIIGKDLTGHITSWNAGAGRLFGYLPEEAIGRPISILIPPDRLHEEAMILDRIRQGDRVEHFETVRLSKDRRKVNVSLSISPIHNNEGEVVGASKIVRDITDRKRIELELAQARERAEKHSQELERVVADRTAALELAYQELEAFTYTVAHDLRSPLRHMRGLMGVLEGEVAPGLPADKQELLGMLSKSAQRMSQLLEDLLKLSRLGKQELHRQPVSLDALVQRAVAEVKPDHEGRVVEWTITALPIVQCDPGLMQQAIINLLSNALKYTRPRSIAKITIGQMQLKEGPAFFVRDNGIGFSMEQAEKLFTPFHRLHPERQFEGSGIGLAAVARIISKHGGKIWAESKPDEGATFFFTLGEQTHKPDAEAESR
jgi:PAS domain S-box-containing protein